MAKITLDVLARMGQALTRQEMLSLEGVVLGAAFKLVADPKDWKKPINARVESEFCDFDRAVLVRAVEHFTATTPEVTEDGKVWVVRAEGYRMGPAGDH